MSDPKTTTADEISSAGGYRPVRAPRGTSITCRSWQQEAALRMLMNNLDPEVAERPRDLVVYGGTGKAAQIEGFAVCGKTGTAEIKGGGRKDKVTWFASFGPFESPRYVVIVMVESGRSGGGTCAPVARRIYQYLHQRDLAARVAMGAPTGGGR